MSRYNVANVCMLCGARVALGGDGNVLALADELNVKATGLGWHHVQDSWVCPPCAHAIAASAKRRPTHGPQCTREARCAAMRAAIDAPTGLLLLLRAGFDPIAIVLRVRGSERGSLLNVCPWCAADLRWWGENPPKLYDLTTAPAAEVVP